MNIASILSRPGGRGGLDEPFGQHRLDLLKRFAVFILLTWMHIYAYENDTEYR